MSVQNFRWLFQCWTRVDLFVFREILTYTSIHVTLYQLYPSLSLLCVVQKSSCALRCAVIMTYYAHLWKYAREWKHAQHQLLIVAPPIANHAIKDTASSPQRPWMLPPKQLPFPGQNHCRREGPGLSWLRLRINISFLHPSYTTVTSFTIFPLSLVLSRVCVRFNL